MCLLYNVISVSTVQRSESAAHTHVSLPFSIPVLFRSPQTTGEGDGHPTPVLSPGKSLGWRSLVGCSPWDRIESDTTERLHFHFSLACTGEGNGNPVQCSGLENPRDGGAWWAAVYGVTQSRTRLKRLSSSSRPPGSSCVVQCIVISCLLFIVSMVRMCPSHSPTASCPWCACLFSTSVSISALQIGSSVSFFLIPHKCVHM